MAWPYSPLTTYVANNVPAIKAADLNALQTAINSLYGFPPLFGDGSDGAFSASAGTTTLTANKNYTTFSLTSTAEVDPDCHVISAQQYIRLRGTSIIDARGVAGTNNSTTAGGGAGSANQTLGTGAAGGAGGGASGTAGTARANTSFGGSGGAGGAGGGGGSAGTGGAGGVASLNAQLEARSITALLNGYLLGYNGSAYGAFPIQGGAGGGGGGQSAATNPGLGGGGGGGVIILCAPIIDIGSGCIVRATGGAGGSQSIGVAGDYGGGGGGGGGGAIILVCTQLIETGTITAAGGAGGAANAQGTGVTGTSGTIIRRVIFS